MIGIYKITNQINGKIYIGQSIDIQTRWIKHKQQMKNLKNKNKLYTAMRQYGIHNFLFEIIEQCNFLPQQLDNRQRYWIEYYNSYEDGYNSTRGGQNKGSWALYNPIDIKRLWDEGCSFSEIQKQIGCNAHIIQQRLRGYNDYNATTSRSRGMIKAAQEGKTCHLNTSLEKMTNQQLKYFYPGQEVHQYALSGEYLASYNSFNSAAKAVSPNKTGYGTNIRRVVYHEDNQRIAYGYQWSLEKLPQLPPIAVYSGKKVKCIETGQIFPSARAAADWCGLKSNSAIKDYCSGNSRYKSAGKHPLTKQKLHWSYIEN